MLLRCLNNKLGVADVSISSLSTKAFMEPYLLLCVSFQRSVSVEIQGKVLQ